MRLRNRQHISLELLDVKTDIRSPSGSSLRGISRQRSDEEMATIADYSQGTYLANMYFPAHLLFDEADCMSDSLLFLVSPRLKHAQLDNYLLINRYVSNGWLLGDVSAEVVS